MNLHLFNACLLAGWLMLVAGVGLWSVPAALVVGGVTLLGLTVFIAFRTGVVPPPRRDQEGS